MSRLEKLGQSHRPGGGGYFLAKAATWTALLIILNFSSMLSYDSQLVSALIFSCYSWREWFGWVVVWEKVTSFKCWACPLS